MGNFSFGEAINATNLDSAHAVASPNYETANPSASKKHKDRASLIPLLIAPHRTRYHWRNALRNATEKVEREKNTQIHEHFHSTG